MDQNSVCAHHTILMVILVVRLIGRLFSLFLALFLSVSLLHCVGGRIVNGGHTLLGRNAQVVYELQGEEVEGVRQEVREVKDEENG